MGEKSQDFSEFAENYYWNHLRRFRFVSIMNRDDFDQDMVIPGKFAKKCNEELSEKLILKGPSGNLWLVQLLKVDGSLLFRDGWKEFVKAHHIQKGDILTFEYEGNSCFNVLIHDGRSQCEREISYLARNDKNILAGNVCLPKKCNMDDSVENAHKTSSNNHASHPLEVWSGDNQQEHPKSPVVLPASELTAVKSLSIVCDDRKRKTRKGEVTVQPIDPEENYKSLSNSESHSPRVSRDDNPQVEQLPLQKFSASNGRSASTSFNVASTNCKKKLSKRKCPRSNEIAKESVNEEASQLKTSEMPRYMVQLIPNRRPATDEEKARAWQVATEINPPNPCFKIELRRSHVCKKMFMSIPSDFVSDHFIWKWDAADLRTQNGKNIWRAVRCAQSQGCSLGFAGTQWRSFVKDNDLEEGDVCCFELCNNDKSLVFDVQIVRAVNEVTPLILKKNPSLMELTED